MRRSLDTTLTRSRHTWFLIGRLIVFGLFAVLGIIFLGWKYGQVFLLVWVTVILTVVLDIVYRKYNPEREFLTWVLFWTDAVLAGILIQFAGGFDGPLAIIYFLHTFAAGVYLGVKGGVIIALSDTVVISGLAYLTIAGFVPLPGSALTKVLSTIPAKVSLQYAGLLVMINGGLLLITGLVAGYLSEHLIFQKGRAEVVSKELSDARAMSREILQSLSDGVLVIRADGKPVAVNRAGLEILGLSTANWKKKISATTVYKQLIRKGTVGKGGELQNIVVDDTVLLCKFGQFFDAAGEEAGIIIAMTDITETVKLRNMLQQQEKLAVVGRLSSTLAHEIRNPLASMSGAAHILSLGNLDWEKSNRMTKLISRQAKRISEIIEGYLELTRERKTDYTDPVSFQAIISESIEVAKQGFGWQIEIESRIESDYVIFGSQTRLTQLLTNLLRNSTEAILDDASGRIVISLLAKPEHNSIELSVSDNGTGIPEDVLSHLYEPFFTTKDNGTGLGLYVVKRIVDDHGGMLSIENNPDGGTTIRIRFTPVPGVNIKESGDTE